MTKVLKTVIVVDSRDVPPGVYEGRWSGYEVLVEIGGRLYEMKTQNGIRGLSVPCTVRVSERGDIGVGAISKE